MKTFLLETASGFIDPRWLQSMRGGAVDAVVEPDQALTVHGQRLVFRDSGLAPNPGTPLRVWVGRWIECARAEDWHEAQRQREVAAQLEREQRRMQEVARLAHARAFNARIGLPVEWSPGIKDVLSGLSERSSGNGCNRATVVHVVLREAFQAGRLVRQAGDLLCTSASGSNGRRWAGDPRVASEGHEHTAAVTCKACLRLAAPWMRQAQPGPDPDDDEWAQSPQRQSRERMR